MRQAQAAKANGNREQRHLQGGIPATRHRIGQQAAGGDDGHGGRALGGAQRQRNDERQQDERQMSSGEALRQRSANAAGGEHLGKHAARARHQDHGGSGGQGRFHDGVGALAVPALVAAQQEHRQAHGHHQRKDGRADEAQHIAQAVALGQQGGTGGARHDEGQRDQDQRHDGAHARCAAGFGCRAVFAVAKGRKLLGRGGQHGVALAVEPARHDLRQRRQRDADGQANDGDPANVALDDGRPAHDAGVRWHHHVRGQHDARHGQAELDGVDARRLAKAVDDGHQDDEAHIKKHRDGQHQRGGGERHGHPCGPQQLREAVGQAGCAARDLNHAPQHGAQRHQDGHRPQRAAHARNQRADDVANRHARGKRHQKAHQHHRHEGVDLPADDEQQEQGNAAGADAEKCEGGHGLGISGRKRPCTQQGSFVMCLYGYHTNLKQRLVTG